MGLAALLVLVAAAATAVARERLVVVNSASWAPYSFLDGHGEPRGLLVDFWRLFGERNGIEVEFELVDWNETVPAVVAGRADAHGGLSWSAPRAEELAFTRPVFQVSTLLFVRTGAGISHLADAADAGASVGVIAGSVEAAFLEEHFPRVSRRPFGTSAAMVEAAVVGSIDAFVADHALGAYRLIEHEALGAFEAVDALYTEPIHVAVRAGDTELLEWLERGFQAITPEEVEAIEWRWLVPRDPLPPWLVPAATGAGVTSLAALVLLHYLALRRTVRRRTGELRAMVAELAAANAELDRRAHRDALTGIANRYRFVDLAHRELDRARRYRRPLALAVLDLDHFKAVNDGLGHAAGDAVLVELARRGERALRATDVLARLGGDEFAILMPETTVEQAREVCQRVVAELSTDDVAWRGHRIPIRASIGVAGWRSGLDVDGWLRQADAALYEAKARAGENGAGLVVDVA